MCTTVYILSCLQCTQDWPYRPDKDQWHWLYFLYWFRVAANVDVLNVPARLGFGWRERGARARAARANPQITSLSMLSILEWGPKRGTVGYLDGCFYFKPCLGEFTSLQCSEFQRRLNRTCMDYVESESDSGKLMTWQTTVLACSVLITQITETKCTVQMIGDTLLTGTVWKKPIGYFQIAVNDKFELALSKSRPIVVRGVQGAASHNRLQG